jgi:hypothetical protein
MGMLPLMPSVCPDEHWRSYVRARLGRGPPSIFRNNIVYGYVKVAQPHYNFSHDPSGCCQQTPRFVCLPHPSIVPRRLVVAAMEQRSRMLASEIYAQK